MNKCPKCGAVDRTGDFGLRGHSVQYDAHYLIKTDGYFETKHGWIRKTIVKHPFLKDVFEEYLIITCWNCGYKTSEPCADAKTGDEPKMGGDT